MKEIAASICSATLRRRISYVHTLMHACLQVQSLQLCLHGAMVLKGITVQGVIDTVPGRGAGREECS